MTKWVYSFGDGKGEGEGSMRNLRGGKGGNLAEILDHISTVIRERGRFQRQVRSLSAEGRASAWVLTLLPFGLAALLQLTSPDYLPLMFEDPLGQRILLGTGALMIIGIFWMRRLIRIEV